jgi:hypothetical protein
LKYFVGVETVILVKKPANTDKFVNANYPDGIKIALLISNRYEAGIQRTEGFKEGIQELVDAGTIEIVTALKLSSKKKVWTQLIVFLQVSPRLN